MLVPDRPAGGGGTSAAADPLARLSAFIVGSPSAPCLLKLGSLARDGGLTLRQFGVVPEQLAGAGRDAEEAFPGIAAVSQAVGQAQCGALGFAQKLPRYPDFRLKIDLETRSVPNGGTLRGTIEGAGTAPVYLLLIDDEGKVQPLGRFLSPRHDGFAAPMVLTGPPKSPTQLLIVLSRPLGGLAAVEGMRQSAAETFFRRLGEEVALRGLDPDFAIAAFSVEGSS